MIVIDASVLAPAMADDGPSGLRARARLQGEDLSAPTLIEPEVISVMRRAWMAGHLSDRRAVQALTDFRSLPLFRAPHRPLLERMWALRRNMTPYDAAYVALAELFGVRLVTADARLGRAPGVRCAVEVVTL